MLTLPNLWTTRKIRNPALEVHGLVSALSSSPTAKNEEEFWLGDYDWGIAKNVNDGDAESRTFSARNRSFHRRERRARREGEKD